MWEILRILDTSMKYRGLEKGGQVKEMKETNPINKSNKQKNLSIYTSKADDSK